MDVDFLTFHLVPCNFNIYKHNINDTIIFLENHHIYRKINIQEMVLNICNKYNNKLKYTQKRI